MRSKGPIYAVDPVGHRVGEHVGMCVHDFVFFRRRVQRRRHGSISGGGRSDIFRAIIGTVRFRAFLPSWIENVCWLTRRNADDLYRLNRTAVPPCVHPHGHP